jgi:hypothetical protein
MPYEKPKKKGSPVLFIVVGVAAFIAGYLLMSYIL